MDNISFIRENIADVKSRVEAAALRSGRAASDICIVAVSKTFGNDLIEEAYAAGMTEFGENYIQEGITKVTSLKIEPRWHFIGHLQKNKVRLAVKHFSMIQSVDSESLLERINKISEEEQKRTDVLIQVNLEGEESKSGFDQQDIIRTIEKANENKWVRICGLMQIPPFYDDPEENRKNFRQLRRMFDDINKIGFPNWNGLFLSMGMTDDFEIAIEEGSNMVRIGRAIFGYRRRKI
ncbi:MAG: YggS family pyridoxal phosphate-dependent enzyme [Firmicutes bacterium]|nr:YggS family pyridoxal phosphate-dependent enzyme [Bacillota bacterium]